MKLSKKDIFYASYNCDIIMKLAKKRQEPPFSRNDYKKVLFYKKANIVFKNCFFYNRNLRHFILFNLK